MPIHRQAVRKRVDLTVAPEQQLEGVQVVEWVGLVTKGFQFIARVAAVFAKHVANLLDINDAPHLGKVSRKGTEKMIDPGLVKFNFQSGLLTWSDHFSLSEHLFACFNWFPFVLKCSSVFSYQLCTEL